MISLIMGIGTCLAAVATLPQILAVFKSRDSLKGYNPIASFGLFLAMVCFGVGFFLMGNYFSVFCEVPVALFWLLASIYSWRSKSWREFTPIKPEEWEDI